MRSERSSDGVVASVVMWGWLSHHALRGGVSLTAEKVKRKKLFKG